MVVDDLTGIVIAVIVVVASRAGDGCCPVAAMVVAMVVGLAASPALALDFRVHGHELGERIRLSDGRRVWTAMPSTLASSTRAVTSARRMARSARRWA